jgi:TonB family protein
MAIVRPKMFRLGALGLLFLFVAPVGRSQFANLDKLGEQFAKQLKPFKPKMVAVADLSALEGAIPDQGHYFSAFLTNSIQYYAKKLPVLGHAEFDTDLKRDSVPATSFVSADAVSALHARIPEDFLVIGNIKRDVQTYTVNLSAVRASSGKILFSESTTFPRTEFMDSWGEPFPPELDSAIFRAGVSGIGTPSCIHCPDPSYNDYARRDKIQGNCVFNVLISSEGNAVRLQPVRLVGDGLDEEAFRTVKTWKFKPATDKEGAPVYVIVPVEVTFRLF